MRSLPSIVKIKRTMCGMKFISKSCPWKYIFGVFSFAKVDGETIGEGVTTDIVTTKLPVVMCDELVRLYHLLLSHGTKVSHQQFCSS